jgi:hypothetical protein
MIEKSDNPNRRVVDTKELIRFANEFLLGAIGMGVRAVSIEVQGDRIRWRCIFESLQAMDLYKPPLEEVEGNLRGVFHHHADVDGEYLITETRNEMEHLNRLLFLRYEV